MKAGEEKNKREILGGPAEGALRGAFRRSGVFSKVGPHPFSVCRPGLKKMGEAGGGQYCETH